MLSMLYRASSGSFERSAKCLHCSSLSTGGKSGFQVGSSVKSMQPLHKMNGIFSSDGKPNGFCQTLQQDCRALILWGNLPLSMGLFSPQLSLEQSNHSMLSLHFHSLRHICSLRCIGKFEDPLRISCLPTNRRSVT